MLSRVVPGTPHPESRQGAVCCDLAGSLLFQVRTHGPGAPTGFGRFTIWGPGHPPHLLKDNRRSFVAALLRMTASTPLERVCPGGTHTKPPASQPDGELRQGAVCCALATQAPAMTSWRALSSHCSYQSRKPSLFPCSSTSGKIPFPPAWSSLHTSPLDGPETIRKFRIAHP